MIGDAITHMWRHRNEPAVLKARGSFGVNNWDQYQYVIPEYSRIWEIESLSQLRTVKHATNYRYVMQPSSSAALLVVGDDTFNNIATSYYEIVDNFGCNICLNIYCNQNCQLFHNSWWRYFICCTGTWNRTKVWIRMYAPTNHLPYYIRILNCEWHTLAIFSITYHNGAETKDRQASSINRFKSQYLNVSRLVLQLSLSNPLKPGVKSRMR